MNTQSLKDSWSHLKESLKQKYSTLREEDLRYVEGKEEELYTKLGQRLNMTREQVDKILSENYLHVKEKLEKAKAKH
ncbi:general stress protein CsbD [Puia dinghuensis]|uniref:General stress protein CsbD n=1 Tax=Puia dinghuensis TaxID=1792502 RepID=A0A8J2UDZ0_9BACT|nr:general stress protein CsbD [Puia dinghuensis]GGB02004.1 hypothetical protein GCM10011511_26560 [Puia dinghuensis]